MIGWVVQILTGGRGLAAELRQAYEARVRATTDEQKLRAEITIAQLQARQDLHRNASLTSRLVQCLWAAPFVIYGWKVIVWDKVLGQWTMSSTDPLGPFEQNLGLMIAGFYFLAVTGAGVANSISRR